MTNFIKAYLDLFIAISLIFAFGQDVYKLVYANRSISPESNPIDNANFNETTNTTQNNLGP